MKKLQITTLIVGLFLLVSCKVEPEQINFGTDACHFCKMTIVDQQHAAQYVTDKGKQFKFDAIECMVNELIETTPDHIAIYLVSDYNVPGHMTPASSAIYLISPAIKSPMGANLTGFVTEQAALTAKADNEGDLYTWDELMRKFDDE